MQTVLILDDEQDWLEKITNGIDGDVEILTATTIEEGISIIESDKPDVIICDSFNVDGWTDVYQAAKEIPMIIVTNDPDTVKEIALAYEITIDVSNKQNPELFNELKEFINMARKGEGESFKD